MRIKRSFKVVIMCLAGLTSSLAHADLYTANAAFQAKDLPRAFELYRELAELGHAGSQETLAIMYVQGEGVRRDNILGYAWAALALEQRPSEAAQSIYEQLNPHVTESGRKTAEELRAKFGKDALKKSILGIEKIPAASKKVWCRIKAPANPDDFFPPGPAEKGVSGFAIIDARVFSDGRDHDPRAARLIPAQPFDGPAMLLSMNSLYTPQIENGKAEPCTMRFKVVFTANPARTPKKVEQDLNAIKKRAVSGNPDSQLVYGLLLRNADGPPSGEVPLDWFIKSAQAGNSFAQYLVGHEQLNSFMFEANEAKGIFWLDKAARAGDNDAQLELANYYMRDASNFVNVRKAVALLERAVEANRPVARFYLSALLASSPDAEVRNPKRALEIFGKDQGIYELNPVAWEIRAVAHANAGEFDEAIDLEKRAIRMARTFHWNTAPLEARLAAYQGKKSWTGDLLAFY
jgi:TPR repeat protein